MEKIYADDDQILLHALCQDSEAAFNKIYDKYWSMVYTDAYRRLKNHAQAQDITQEIFVKLWIRRDELNISNLRAYLKVSVRNRVLNLFEKERRYISFEQLLYNNIRAGDDHADRIALKNEFMEAYNALVNALPAQRQKIFRYHFDDGLPTEEIARRMELSRKTVQNQLGRATSFLKTQLTHLFLLCVIFWL